MVQISCGCTQQSPGPTCQRGKELFAAASQAFQDLVTGTAALAGDERRAVYTLAHLAYIDHLRGWWEGDVKVQRRMGIWMIYARLCGRWIFHFGAKDNILLEEWLHMRGYQQYVRGTGEYAKDRLSGYYRKDAVRTVGGKMSLSLSPEPVADTSIPGEHVGMLVEQGTISSAPSSSQIDLKTRVAVHIALLVARIPRSLTVVDRLFVERRAAHLLQAHGIQVGPSDEKTLGELIDEAVRQKEGMNASPERYTQ